LASNDLIEKIDELREKITLYHVQPLTIEQASVLFNSRIN